jgi:hypothetical protein
MQRWLMLTLLAGALVFPISARAQNAIRLASLQVELRPEYDQPSMLVICDFRLPEGTKLPVDIAMRLPKEANFFAFASQAADGNLLNAGHGEPTVGDTWQTVSLQVQNQTTYQLEYYQPLSKAGNLRQFSYLWAGDYAVDDFVLSVRVPPDTTSISTNPEMPSVQGTDGTPLLTKDFGVLGAGQQFPLQLTYTKTSAALSVSQQKVQPSQPLGANTPGRVMLSNYVPYFLGVLGFVLIIGGAVYFWQSSRGRRALGNRHRRRAPRAEGQSPSDVYCHQCGARAETGDRFCRVCGTQLRRLA